MRAQSLTRDEAVRIALKNSLGIELGRNAVAIASISNSYGIAGGLPVVTGSVSNQEQSTSIKQVYSNPANNKASNNAFSNSLTGGINGYMLLYNGQRVMNAKRQLNTLEAQSRQVLGSRALVLVNNVLLKYYDGSQASKAIPGPCRRRSMRRNSSWPSYRRSRVWVLRIMPICSSRRSI